MDVRDFVDETWERAHAGLEYLWILDNDDHVKFHPVAAGTKIAMLNFVFVPRSQPFSAVFFLRGRNPHGHPAVSGGERYGSFGLQPKTSD